MNATVRSWISLVVAFAASACIATPGWAADQAASRPTRKPNPDNVRRVTEAQKKTADLSLNITSWNAFSKQFIAAPTFSLLPRTEAAQYKAVIRQGQTRLEVASKSPNVSLKPLWAKVADKTFEIDFKWLRKNGREIHSLSTSYVKAPGWKGLQEKPMDWAASADRNIAFLIDSAENGPAKYREPGVPVWVWQAIAVQGVPRGSTGYPSLHMPLMIRAFAACAEMGRPQADEARQFAETCGNWLLTHRQPDSSVLPLFPYSTISDGKLIGGGADKRSVNLLRASHMAIGLVRLFELTGEEKFLDYACHIADVTIKFQEPDGSFPYRVNPETGEVTERYTCHASEFVALVDALTPHREDPNRTHAAKRAVNWMLSYPYVTNHWQSGYEDVGVSRPYQNMENWAINYLVRHLCQHKDEDPRYLPAAQELNRWVEDQFVVFGRDEAINVNCPVPLTMEQYGCFFPMEVHTGNWILALIELHKATQEKEYLDKAMAAANATAKSQASNGEYSTWGVDIESGKPARVGVNWYGCNAWATEALYTLSDYVKSGKK